MFHIETALDEFRRLMAVSCLSTIPPASFSKGEHMGACMERIVKPATEWDEIRGDGAVMIHSEGAGVFSLLGPPEAQPES